MSKTPLWIACSALAGVAFLGLFADAPTADAEGVDLSVALSEQQRLVAEQPSSASAANDLGNLLAASGRWDEAEEAYRSAILADPGYPDAHYNLGILLQQVDRADEARSVYLELLEIDPSYAWAQYQLGKILEERGSESRAIERYARAFAQDPMLSFAEINPHVIDSQLTTEALLRSDRYRSRDSLTPPRQYAEGSRIVGLLVEDPPAEALAEAEGAPDRDPTQAADAEAIDGRSGLQQAGELGARPVFPEAAAPVPAPEESAREASRVLGNEDLDPSNNAGQVVGGGVVSRPSTRGRSFAGNPRGRAATRGTTPPSTVAQPIGRSGAGTRGETSRGGINTNSPSGTTVGGSTSGTGAAAGRGRYRPSSRSNAQLDLRLEPVRMASIPPAR